MKKLLYYICTATFLFALASCSNELETDGEVKGNTELSVTIGDNTTRVSVNQQGKTTWSKGDEISVYTTLNRFQTFTLEGDGGNKTGKFIGYLDADEQIVDYAVYPAGDHQVSSGGLKINMPKKYNYKSGDAFMPLVAQVTQGTNAISFSHAGGLLSCTIKNIPSTAKGFMLITDSKQITGNFDLQSQAIHTQNITGKDTIRLDLQEEATSEMTFNVPLPEGTYNTISVALTNADGNPISTTLKRSTVPNTVAIGSVLQLPAYKVLGPDFYVKVNGTGEGSSWDDAMSGEKFRDMVNSNAFSSITYPSANETIFSGDLNHNGTPDQGDCHLMQLVMNGNQTITFNGIIFKGGYLSQNLNEIVRPGIYINGNGTDARFNYCKFVDNISKLNGGNYAGGAAIGLWRGSATLYRCEMSGNKSHDRGGAIRLIHNSPKLFIDQCLFYNNSTEGDWGGCIQCSTAGATVVINNSTFYSNTTGSGGGAVNGSCMSYISNSTFVNNSCANDPQDFRTESHEKHYTINTIIVGSNAHITGSKANIFIRNNSFTSEGYTVYGTVGGAGTFNAGTGDMAGRYTEDIFGTPNLTNQGGTTLILKPLAKINGATLTQLRDFKTKYKDIIPASFDLTVDQRGKKRQETTTVGAFEFE